MFLTGLHELTGVIETPESVGENLGSILETTWVLFLSAVPISHTWLSAFFIRNRYNCSSHFIGLPKWLNRGYLAQVPACGMHSRHISELHYWTHKARPWSMVISVGLSSPWAPSLLTLTLPLGSQGSVHVWLWISTSILGSLRTSQRRAIPVSYLHHILASSTVPGFGICSWNRIHEYGAVSECPFLQSLLHFCSCIFFR